MTVAGTLGNRVVGSASAGSVKVVATRGNEAEAEAETPSVMVASGNNVVSSVGITMTVVGSSVGSCAGIVTVAGTSGNRVVGSASAGRVNVVGISGKSADRDTDASRVTVAEGKSVVSSLGTTVIVAGASLPRPGTVNVAGTSGSNVVGSASAGIVNVVGTSGRSADTDTDASRVTVAEGNKVVSSLGTTVTVVGAPLGSSAGTVNVAGTSGSKVVGSASPGRVSVVATNGTDTTGSDAEADTETPKVTVASGNRVVSSVGTTVIVLGRSLGSTGCSVIVAGTSDGSVVGSKFGGKVKVVSTRGTEVGRPVSTDGIVRVNETSGKSVVASVGRRVTVRGSSAGSSALIVSVAETPGSNTVGSASAGRVTVVKTRGIDVGRSVPTAGAVRVMAASGSKVVASVGMIVTTEVISPGLVGCRVKVAETSGSSVVASTG